MQNNISFHPLERYHSNPFIILLFIYGMIAVLNHVNERFIIQMTNFKPVGGKDTFDINWIVKETRCWIYFPNQNDSDIFIKGVVKGIVPLSINKANSRVSGITENGSSFEVKAHQLERCRESNSLEKDLIEMDIINAPEVLMQLKRRLGDQKIHTCLWNSLIIVNPFKLIPEQYSDKCLSSYFDSIFIKGEDIRKHEPHIFSFMFQILGNIDHSEKTQVISISGQSGSGKTETNKQALRAISFCSSRVLNMHHEKTSNMQTMILKCDPILEVFGNAKTIKNDNSSRFGKLISLKINGRNMKIYHSSIKNYFLEKSRIIGQSPGERNFHIFYQFIAYLSDQQRNTYRMKSSTGYCYRQEDFNYISQKMAIEKNVGVNDRQMWDELNQALVTLQFRRQVVHEIWSLVAAVLLIGNINFDSTPQGENQPCDIRNPDIAESVAYLLGVQKKDFHEALVTHRRTIGGDLVLSSLSERQCIQGRDSMAKAIYESLFHWLIEELNRKLNVSNAHEQHVRHIKLLDIYGFQVFENNSFEQLCVNYTNQKIHQIYLEQVFIHEKTTLKKEGLESIISKLNFTDNIKIIELLDTLTKSVFNLLDESCSVNVKDDDFLANVRKQHDQHEHFPPSNNINLRKSFIIKHTPGDIQYMAEGFRDKNKDLIREDIVVKLSKSRHSILSHTFKERAEVMKGETNKRFLGIKIRRQVKELILEMSTNTDLHFIRCIKPNQQKKPFLFVDRVCFNQIKYLGILDTIQMRKESYHIRKHYSKFYLKYGILENKISNLIAISQRRLSAQDCKDIAMRFITNHFVNYNIDYQFGKDRIFLKMSAQNVLENLLKKRVRFVESAATLIKVHFRRSKMAKRRSQLQYSTWIVQRAIRSYLKIARQLKKKRAVRTIENAWIKYHQVFFARKKRPKLMIFQKYFRTKHAEITQNDKIEAVRRCKFLLKSLAQGNKLVQKMQNYRVIKKEMLGSIYDRIWQKMRLHYRSNLIKYLKGWTVLDKNKKQIRMAAQNQHYRLNMKYRNYLEKYLRGFHSFVFFSKKMAAIIMIQSCFRMFKLRHKYNSLRKTVIKIQRNWRKYYYDKKYNLRYTDNYFNNKDDDSSVRNQREYWKSLLFRDVTQSSKSKQRGIESILYMNDKVKQDKVGMFYYLLDFQILTNLTFTYPGYSWIQNYITLYENAWEKGNPIQTVQVSDEHTICVTINKVYTWGDYSLEDLISNDEDKFKSIKALTLPPGRMEKAYAHNKFTVVQIQDEEPYVIGDSKLYSQDSSNKQWKTLNESFVIINGVVLTLKRVNFSRVPITEKIVQLSCGMDHCIAKTSLRKVYTWGNNSHGQLGVGHFKRVKKPKIVQFFKNNFVIQQVACSAYGSMALDSNGRLFWWGSNGSITNCNHPVEAMLFEKSEFIDNSQRYSIVRILPSWSKSLSLIGVTICSHEGIFKSSQNNIKKKTFENLMSKWNEDISTITPPYIQSICGYFQEKLMPKGKQLKEGTRNRDLENQRIRQKLLAEITLMEEAQRALLQERRL